MKYTVQICGVWKEVTKECGMKVSGYVFKDDEMSNFYSYLHDYLQIKLKDRSLSIPQKYGVNTCSNIMILTNNVGSKQALA